MIDLEKTQKVQQSSENVIKPPSRSKAKRFKAPDYLREMNILDKLENHQIIKNMNKRINYLKNPRFAVNYDPIRYQDVDTKPDLETKVNEKDCPYRPSPKLILFQDYMINQIYEIKLYLTNIGKVSRRFKYLPPKISQFAVTEVIYPCKLAKNELEEDPNKEFGLIAPGMSVTLSIKFHATSFAEFEDEIVIFGDEKILKIPLVARREAPSINLPELLDCQSCWLGDRADMVYRVTNKGGEAGFKFFKESEVEEENVQPIEVLKLNNFTIYPAEFFIQKNETIEIFLQYYPTLEGTQSEKVILACDNQTSAEYSIQGKGNMVELSIYALDDFKIENVEKEDSSGLKSIFFKDAYPNEIKTRQILIQNQTTVKVKYHWSLFKSGSTSNQFKLEDNSKFAFKIEPSEGFFNQNEIINFKISYLSSQSIPIYEYANLFIDDIPLQSIRNPPESLKKQLEEQQKDKQQEEQSLEKQIQQPGFFGSNTNRPSFSYYEFELIGLSRLCKIEAEPSFYCFPNELYIEKNYNYKFKLKNSAKCKVQYTIRENQLSHSNMSVSLPSASGLIDSDSFQEIEIGFTSFQIGLNQKAQFIIDFDYADSIEILICGNFIGPHIQFDIPIINFGLFKSFSVKETFLVIQNTSQIDAECYFNQINFSNLPSDFAKAKAQILEQGNSEITDLNYELNPLDDTHKPPRFWFHPQFLNLQPQESKKIKITCQSFDPESHLQLIQIAVKNGVDQYLQLTAEIQDIHISLNLSYLNPDNVLINKPSTFLQGQSAQWIEIHNLGNIESKFKWEKVESDDFTIKFEPSEGIAPPKTRFPIKITFIPKIQGKFSRIFVCECFGLEYPLGFQLDTDIQGLSIEYELVTGLKQEEKNASTLNIQRMPGQKITSTFLQQTIGKQKKTRKEFNQILETDIESATPLKVVEFYGCQVNVPKSLTIIIKNTSGIETTYNIFAEAFRPYIAELESSIKSKSDQNKSSNQSGKFNETVKSNATNTTQKKSTKNKKMVQHPKPISLLTAEIEKKNNFTSNLGHQRNEEKKLDKDQRNYLQNNLGIAITCDKPHGEILPFSEVIVTITMFNEICGFFTDQLCFEVKGMPLQKFPVNIDIQGTPVIITPNQLGIDYKGDYPSYHLGYYMNKSSTVVREFRIQNTGPRDIKIEWKMFNLDKSKDEQNRKFFDVQIIPPLLGSGKIAQLDFVPVEPLQALDGPFKLNSYFEIIKGRQEKTFKVSFNSDLERQFNSVIIAQPVFVQHEEIKLGKLAMYLKCETIIPNLYLDKLISNSQNQQMIKFEKWALEQNKKEEKHFALINQKKANVVFNIQLSGPFSITSMESNSTSKYELNPTKLSNKEQQQQQQTNFILVSTSNLDIKIKFNGPNIKNQDEWPNEEQIQKEGGLLITYQNGIVQQIKLLGILLRPRIFLNTSGHEGIEGKEIQEFGLVHINNKKTIVIFLSNITKCPARWKINNVKNQTKKSFLLQSQQQQQQQQQQSQQNTNNIKIENYSQQEELDDPSVYEFSVTDGLLFGKSIPVKSLPDTSALPTQFTSNANERERLYPQKILINFRPKKNIIYKSKFRVNIEEGNFQDFILRGTGTYEEHLEKH